MADVAATNTDVQDAQMGIPKELSHLSATAKQAISWGTEISAGLTVSFVAMSLGAAFGVQSGRGPLPGIMSAGFIALITSILGGTIGGTRVQCSGPTAPMTAVSAAVVLAVMGDDMGASWSASNNGVDPVRYINLIFLLTGFILILCGICQVGKLITYVPKIVISGFMNGIAISIWQGEVFKVYGLGGKDGYTGGLILNTVIMLSTFAIVFGLPKALDAMGKGWMKKFLPSTLIGIVLVTALCMPLSEISHVKVGEPLSSFSAITNLFSSNMPTAWSGSLIVSAIPSALNLTMLCYLDTLLTSLVMDQKVEEKYRADGWRKTNQNSELMSQGIANGFCSLFGGLPGAQATIRSVLILNEGARTPLAGIMVGVFVIVEMIALQSLIGMIPSAVFSGVLLKVGYDVLDWVPAWMYIKTKLFGRPHPNGEQDVHVSHIDMLFIIGTTLVTLFVNLNIAVAAFTVAFYFGKLVKIEITDMPSTAELKDKEPVTEPLTA